MSYKKNIDNIENSHLVTEDKDLHHYTAKGVYLRDDHCDWGSSGMNEFTKEFSENK